VLTSADVETRQTVSSLMCRLAYTERIGEQRPLLGGVTGVRSE
jgi:hypothetical protein